MAVPLPALQLWIHGEIPLHKFPKASCRVGTAASSTGGVFEGHRHAFTHTNPHKNASASLSAADVTEQKELQEQVGPLSSCPWPGLNSTKCPTTGAESDILQINSIY